MKKQVYELTKEGLQTLRDELEYLKDVKRPEVLLQLQESKMLGDLSENADYDAARDAQAATEARIKELEMIIENAKIIRVSKANDRVSLGKSVRLKFVEKNKEMTYQLLGSIEANPGLNKISINSPVGKSINGAEVGDVVVVNLENGKSFHVEVLEVLNG